MKIAYIAGLLGFVLLGFAIGLNPFGEAFILLGLLFGLGAVILWVSDLRVGSKYDLKKLEKVDREERRRAIEDQLEELDSAGNAVCLSCMNHFDPELGRCPRCGRSLF